MIPCNKTFSNKNKSRTFLPAMLSCGLVFKLYNAVGRTQSGRFKRYRLEPKGGLDKITRLAFPWSQKNTYKGMEGGVN